MTKSKKIICIILAGLIAVSAVTGTLFYIFNNYSKNNFTTLDSTVNSKNYVNFKNDVNIIDNPSEIQKNYKDISVKNDEYTMVYKKTLPDFFKDKEKGEVFCVYPDKTASESFFNLGFCGKITKIIENDDICSVSFTMPKITDVFKDISINTNSSNNTSVTSTSFYPSKDISNVECLQTYVSPDKFAYASINPLSHNIAKKEFSFDIGDNSVKYKYKEPETTSLLEDYTLVCEELKLKFDCTFEDDDGYSLGAKGDVTLEETAVKMALDYQYDEKTDKIKINEYSLGFITKQKVDLSFSGEKSFGLDDINFNLSDDVPIVDVVDVTESEKGKIILGTYLIGLESSLPILQNDTNKVSYLSFGIAIQLTLTGNGELSLEYNLEESGFAQIEVNDDKKNTYLIKGYDYPNPVTESREPTDEEMSSKPSITNSIKGSAKFDLAFGGDIGVCILGMIPIKQANNFFECEINRTLINELDDDKKVDLISNNYLLDDDVNSLIISANSHFKSHLGVNIKKHKVGEMGTSYQLFKDVIYQSPPATGFSHSQCGFGGVFVGETYSDEELSDAYKNYMKDTNQESIITSAKDSLFGTVVNKAFNDLDFDPLDIASYLGGEIDDYKFNYYTSGVIYVRDESDEVVAAFITGKDISNITGVHNGLSYEKIEQVYSAPDLSANIKFNIGTLARLLFNIDGPENSDITGSTYNSCDSNEKMNLIFSDGSLSMIIVSKK